MSEIKHAPQRPVHVVRGGSVEVSVWKWCDGRETRFELAVNRAYSEGEKKARYPERFRADHITDLRDAMEEAASWIRVREEKLTEFRKTFKRREPTFSRRLNCSGGEGC